MRAFFFLLCSLFPAMYGQDIISQNQKADLVQRLNDFDAIAFQMAIDDMQTGGAFPLKEEVANGYAGMIIEERPALIEKIRNGDVPSINRTVALLDQIDGILLSNPLLKDKKILSIRQHFEGDRARKNMGASLGLAPSNFQNNSEIHNPSKGWNNELIELDPSGKGKIEILYKPEPGMIFADAELHWSGDRLMYSSLGVNGRWHLFEVDLNDRTSRQITPAEYVDFDSFDGCYAGDGTYIFCSTATFLGLPCTDGGNKMCGIFSYDPKTRKSRQLTFDQDSNWNPVLMDNGHILYQRWEYADLPHSNSRMLFSMKPDGTAQTAYYGSNSYFPTAFFGVRPIPGKPGCLVGIAGGHHSVSRSGQLLLVNTSKGLKESEGVTAEIPYRGKKVDPEVRDRLSDGKWPQFLHPYPLSDKYFLVSMKRSPSSLWGLYLVDVFNNMTLIREEEECALLEPVVRKASPTPPVIPSHVDNSKKTATVFLQDVYAGNGLKGIPRGAAVKLRVGTYSFSPLGQGGLLGTIGLDGPWDVKIIVGEVDIERDGSCMFQAPANTPLFVQPLDADGKALQIMRSWFTAMPGENLSCVGCHENRHDPVAAKQTIASRKKPQAIKPFHEQQRGTSFLHEVQPILDRACVACHGGQNPDIPYFKSDKLIADWNSGISGRGSPSFAGKFTESYYQLQRYVRRPGIESDMDMLVPMDVHADQTELFHVLNKGHHNVKLTVEEKEKLACWIDMNAPFHGRRDELTTFPKTQKAYQMRAKYAPLFGLDRNDAVWLPDRKLDIPAELPAATTVPPAESPVLAGWPYFQSGTHYHANQQIGLGHFQKTIDLGNGISMKLVKVPAGSFIMGSGRHPDETPMHIQKVERPFWIGQFEVTNEQYALFDKGHDSRTEHRHGYQFGRKGYPLNDPKQPAVRVSWEESMEFCKWLSEKTGLDITLPTEIQWEWACRAGSDRAYSFGDIGGDYSRFANFGDKRLKDFAACTAYKNYESSRILENPNRYDDWVPRDDQFDDGGFVSGASGSYKPNSWDIYDMHGNVWEWTASSYKPYPCSREEETGLSASPRVARGGSWYDRPFKGTSTYRLPYRPYQKVFNVGFRIVVNEFEYPRTTKKQPPYEAVSLNRE